ncbi:MAG: N-acetylmuramoyl-L-alanine amidase, partial [Lachnospiraceae bacterium]|nr:N-acetylmuramoyl-L-alanine amidase [Lachnospiraceae bacterium]
MLSIFQNLVPKDKWDIKCPYAMKPEYIVVHNTDNDACARNEIAYMTRNNNEVSFHYAVDDKEVIQGISDNRNAWHAGDGAYGTGNRKGIAIEICFSESGGVKFDKAEQNAAELITMKMKEYNIPISKVKRHYDFATDKKRCPHRTMDKGWERFLDMVQKAYDGSKPASKPTARPTPTVKKTVEQIAKEVLAGKWGNGDTRKQKLKTAGYDYNAVQAKVNELSKPQIKPTTVKPKPSTPKKQTVTLPKTAKEWRVYKTNVAPIVGNECGKLKPSKYGGLTYEILAKPQKDVVTIQTQ